MSLSPESAECGVVPALLEVVQSLPAFAGALGRALAEKGLLTSTPLAVVSTFPQNMQMSPFGGTFPRMS